MLINPNDKYIIYEDNKPLRTSNNLKEAVDIFVRNTKFKRKNVKEVILVENKNGNLHNKGIS